MDATTAIITAILASSGVWSVVLYLFQRKDKKSEDAAKKTTEQLSRIEEHLKTLDGKVDLLEKSQNDTVGLLSKAVVSDMHHTIRGVCEGILTEYAEGKRRYMDIDELHDLTSMYDAYHALGGNGTCKILFERVNALPLKQTNDPT